MLKYSSLVALPVFFFVSADVARAQSCPPPKAPNHPIVQCYRAYGATWQYDNRYGRCLWIAPYQREMQVIDCAVQAGRRQGRQ